MPVKKIRGPGAPVSPITRRGVAFTPRPAWPDECLRLWTADDEPGQEDYVASFVIPCWNMGRWLRQAVESCLQQTGVPGSIQVVIVDDGSTDSTPHMIRDLQKEYGRRIVGVREPQHGVSATCNRGVRRATAPVIVLCAADDINPPDRLALSLGALAEHEADMVYGQQLTFTTDPQKTTRKHGTGPPGAANILRGCGFGTGTMAARRSLFTEKGVWLDETMAGAEDHEYLVACVEAGAKVVCLGDTLLLRRQHFGSLRTRVDWLTARRYIMLKHRAFLEQYTGQPIPVTEAEAAEVWRRYGLETLETK